MTRSSLLQLVAHQLVETTVRFAELVPAAHQPGLRGLAACFAVCALELLQVLARISRAFVLLVKALAYL